jgi:hypothetical protein
MIDLNKEKRMNSIRKNAVITGVIFIIATVAALLAAAILPVIKIGTNYLTLVSSHSNQVATSAFFNLIAAFSSGGIAVSMYPVLKGSNLSLALGSVIFRAMEGVLYIVAVVSLLSLLMLSQDFTNAEVADRFSLQAISDMLLNARDLATLAAVFSFSLGAFMYYYIFFQSRLIPRWLSGWGIAAVILMMIACVLALFSGKPVTGYTLLIIPIALQEMVLAVWLIVKGFSIPNTT